MRERLARRRMVRRLRALGLGHSGANTNGLTADAISFKTYGTMHGIWHPGAALTNVAPGDVVGYNFDTTSKADDHVGIIVSINTDGTMTTIEGNLSNGVNQRTLRRSDSTVSGYVSPVV
jgi:uncharacterized protein YijF (DUF1287 family)